MADQVERFDVLPGLNPGHGLSPNGRWVRYSDYEKLEAQLRECEDTLRSTEAEFARFRDDMSKELRGDTGGSIESLSWDQLLGVAIRNGNEAMKCAAERDQVRKQVLEEVRGDEAVEVLAKRSASRGGFTWKHTNSYYRNLYRNKARGDLRAVLALLHPDQSKGAMVASKSGAELIAAERERQVSEEGWTPEHDDKHDDGELARAAAAYALVAGAGPTKQVGEAEALWPFQDGWKPSEDEIRDLAKAGALVAAEIDRLQHPDQSKGEQ